MPPLEETSTRTQIKTPPLVAELRRARGLIDTSVLVDLESINPAQLPHEVSVSAITMAELSAGPHAATTMDERARRQDRLQRAEAAFEPLPFDREAARSYGRVYAAVAAAGRKPRGRAVDLLIAAVAVANELPLFTRNIELERENENVQIGKLLDEESYRREQKAIAIDERIVIDWIETKVNADGSLLLHEVKKSRAVEEAHRLQMLYYLYYLRCKGVEAHGQLDYPLLKKTEAVELTPAAETELRAALSDIARIVESDDVPPRLTKKRFCEKCAYFEFCWS